MSEHKYNSENAKRIRQDIMNVISAFMASQDKAKQDPVETFAYLLEALVIHITTCICTMAESGVPPETTKEEFLNHTSPALSLAINQLIREVENYANTRDRADQMLNGIPENSKPN